MYHANATYCDLIMIHGIHVLGYHTVLISMYNYCVPIKISELLIYLCLCVCELSYAGSGPFSECTNSCQDEGGTARQMDFTLLTLSPCPYCSVRLIGTPSFLTVKLPSYWFKLPHLDSVPSTGDQVSLLLPSESGVILNVIINKTSET